jgi:serine protease Do
MDIRDIAERVGPSVVGLATRRGGSAIVVAAGRALTLARTVAGLDAVTAVVGGERVEARVVGRDEQADAAVLAFDAAAPAITWAPDDAGIGIGSEVLALGDPGGRGLRATPGHVASAPRGVRGPRGRLIDGVLEHTAPLPRGTGGGPLVDGEGRVVGLNAVRRPGGLIRPRCCAPRPRRWRRARTGRRGASASGWHRPPSPGACAPRSACRRPTACSSRA